jgi:hypothetical protein
LQAFLTRARRHAALQVFPQLTRYFDFEPCVQIRPRTYPFFEDIYPIPYHGQKSDIISYPLSRQKKDKILYPILSNFLPASQDAGNRIGLEPVIF